MTLQLQLTFLFAADCGALPSVMNGKGLALNGTTYNQVALYVCKTGFKRSGPSTRTCLADGRWSGQPPTCQPLGGWGRFLLWY